MYGYKVYIAMCYDLLTLVNFKQTSAKFYRKFYKKLKFSHCSCTLCFQCEHGGIFVVDPIMFAL